MSKNNRTLLLFSGLAWNLKSTIVDEVCKQYPDAVRLEQTNKSVLSENPDANPMELFKIFIDTNKEVLCNSSNTLVVSDRSMFDHFIYDIIMNPTKVWQLPHLLNPIEYSDEDTYIPFNTDIYWNILSSFDKVIVVSLETSNRTFIRQLFSQQPYSSTSYLFDNPDKYRMYSNQFNLIADRAFMFLKVQFYSNVLDRQFDRLHLKFTETMTPEVFKEYVLHSLSLCLKN